MGEIHATASFEAAMISRNNACETMLDVPSVAAESRNDGSGSERNGVELGSVWRQLLVGNTLVRESDCRAGRLFLLVEKRPHPVPIDPSHSSLLELVLQSPCPKALAIELGMAMSTLSSRCSGVLAAIGVKGRTACIPLILAMAAEAARGRALPSAACETVATEDPSPRQLISVPEPTEGLRGLLSPAEYQVARLAVLGLAYTEIAQARRSSTRTIANQLACVFKKLRLSGRIALRARAIADFARAYELVRAQRCGP
jgi:DNA-binding CsgD family transcriptional regulator